MPGFDLSKHFAVVCDWARRADMVLQLARSHVTSEVSRERRKHLNTQSGVFLRDSRPEPLAGKIMLVKRINSRDPSKKK
jgi:hypothetical protein